MIPGSANALLLASAAAGGYQISRSLRFNSIDSAYLSRTPASAGNRKTWTYSWWCKRGNNGGIAYYMFDASNGTGESPIRFELTNGYLDIIDDSNYNLRTTQVFRDFSSWYHFVVAYNSTEAVASSRLKVYVNGSQITSFSTATYPALDALSRHNNNIQHNIGRYIVGANRFYDGYLADIHFIDGQALDPTSFTEVSATTGQLIPKVYTGTFTGNSFWLKFADNSAATATTLGKDSSGLGNNWTPNNLSVTAGAGNDSLVDTPTSYGTDTGAGGEVRGNFCTLSPVAGSGASLSNGNLDFVSSTANWGMTVGTIGVSSGKWYWEVTQSATGEQMHGVALTTLNYAEKAGNPWCGKFTTTWGYYSSNGNKYNDSSTGTAYGASYTSGDVIGIALNLDAGTLTFYKNGVSQGTAFTGLSGTFVPGVSTNGTSCLAVCNFGQRPFAYTAPSGFKALCDTNLPSTTITTSGSYTGNGVADGPFVYLNGVPTAMTVGGNAVTFGTHADKLSNGFKIRTTSTTYNQNALVYNYTITSTGAAFKNARAQANP